MKEVIVFSEFAKSNLHKYRVLFRNEYLLGLRNKDYRINFRSLKKAANPWLLGLLLLSLILRLFQISDWSFWHDEALTVLLAQKSIPEVIAITATDVHPPLYYLIVKGFLLFGQNELTARLPSVLFGVGSVLALYLLGQMLFDKAVGLVGGYILAISPLQLFYAQEARMYTQLVCLTILSVWCLFYALQTNQGRWWSFFVIGATLSCYTADFAFPVLGAMGVYVLFIDRRRKRIYRFLVATGVIVLLYLPWLSIFITQTRAVAATYWIAPPHPLLLFTTVSGFFTSYTLPAWGIIISLAATLFIIFVALNSLRHALRQQRDVKVLSWLLLWGAIPLATMLLISWLVVPIFQLRTVMTAAPAFYLLVAWAIIRTPYRHLNLLIFLPLLAMMGISIFNFYFNPVFAKPAWREAAFYVQSQTQAGDVVFHTSPGSLLPFLAYETNLTNTKHILLPDPEVSRQNAPSQPILAAVAGSPQTVEAVITKYNRAWLVIGLDQSIAYQTAQKAQFDTRFLLFEENEVGSIYIFGYRIKR